MKHRGSEFKLVEKEHSFCLQCQSGALKFASDLLLFIVYLFFSLLRRSRSLASVFVAQRQQIFVSHSQKCGITLMQGTISDLSYE